MTYRLAVISDVHADVHALQDALRHIDAKGCDAIVCAGDCVDYGLFANETLALLARRAIPTVRGNHDRWALDGDYRSEACLDLVQGRPWCLFRSDGSGRGASSTTERGSRCTTLVRDRTWTASFRPSAPRHPLELSADRPHLDASALLGKADILIVGHTHLAVSRSASATGSS